MWPRLFGPVFYTWKLEGISSECLREHLVNLDRNFGQDLIRECCQSFEMFIRKINKSPLCVEIENSNENTLGKKVLFLGSSGLHQ